MRLPGALLQCGMPAGKSSSRLRSVGEGGTDEGWTRQMFTPWTQTGPELLAPALHLAAHLKAEVTDGGSVLGDVAVQGRQVGG